MRYYYTNSISNFLNDSETQVIGELANNHIFPLDQPQKDAWNLQIKYLKTVLNNFKGQIIFEFAIPRMGKRVDVILIIKNVIFVIEFKIGETNYLRNAIDQVWDYALDLKNFHESSKKPLIAPILVCSEANDSYHSQFITSFNDNLYLPIKSNIKLLPNVIQDVLDSCQDEEINIRDWLNGKYSPTPSIIEAALALFNNHSVEEISRNDADAINLSITSNYITEVIEDSKRNNKKTICFVTGVPGAGKTLVGLDIATKHLNPDLGTTSVFLSGNGPLVDILREALTLNKVKIEKLKGKSITKKDAGREVKTFIQNVHHFRDECLEDDEPPFDHVAIFDEAQRAWNQKQTESFMLKKKGKPNFNYSEPEFLISCLDRHKDWAVIICLVGGGQEINTGEAGIAEWIDCFTRSFKDWNVCLSSKLEDTEYAAGIALKILNARNNVIIKDELHLSVCLRSFRAEKLSYLIKNILDNNVEESKNSFNSIKNNYPIALTRDINKAKNWLKNKARGTERYGIIAASKALRLKPHSINVKTPIDHVHWFLKGKEDTRSSYYLEDVATEFQVQGLELDWTCVAWDGDFRFNENNWETFSFSGNTWKKISIEERKLYLKNAYRVLLTRARQGMVIFIPEGDKNDHTRKHQYYDGTFNYLREIGFEVL